MFAALRQLAVRHRALLIQFATFVGVGLTAFAGHFTTLAFLVEHDFAGPVAGSLAGFVVGGFISYNLNHRFTFESTRTHAGSLPRFIAVAAVAFLLNGGLMELLVHRLGVYYLLAQVITTGLVLIWTFTSYRLWAFAHKTGARRPVA